MLTTRRARWLAASLAALFILALAVTGGRLLSSSAPGGAASNPPPRFAGPGGSGSVVVQQAATGIAPDVTAGPIADQLVVPVSLDVDLRSLPQTPPVRRERHEPEEGSENWESRIEPGLAPAGFIDPIRQTAVGAAAMPASIQNFAGLDFANWGDGWPPDPNGDVGPNN